jgi:hypothetical protein
MWNRIVSKQSSTAFSINRDEASMFEQRRPLLHGDNDDDESLETPYMRVAPVSFPRWDD